MLDLEWAVFRTLTLWKLITRFSRNIVAVALSFVTRLTKMCITPAEPLSNRTAKFAFEFDEVLTVFFAVFDATSYSYCCTFTTDELFLFKTIVVILSRFTIFHASEVGVLAFETHIIRKLVQRKPFKIIVESVALHFQSRSFM